MARHPEFAPDPSLSREEMEALQREVAATTVFDDDFGFDPSLVGTDAPDAPVVVGVDQAFLDDRAVSALVATRGDRVVEETHAVSPVAIPYVPGLLSFREGGPILDAFETLSVTPDLAVFDGSGRIHFRQAGLATHMGCILDVPSVGAAKSLLCGRPRRSLDDPLPAGARVAVEADERVDAPAGTVLGYAVQTRQFESGRRHVNPLYVSPGHRVGARRAADFVERLCAGYKLPEPVRLADAHADEVKERVGGAGAAGGGDATLPDVDGGNGAGEGEDADRTDATGEVDDPGR